jgi:hypothetical protein
MAVRTAIENNNKRGVFFEPRSKSNGMYAPFVVIWLVTTRSELGSCPEMDHLLVQSQLRSIASLKSRKEYFANLRNKHTPPL